MKKFRPGVSFGDFVVKDMAAARSRIKEEGQRDFRRGGLIWLGVVLAIGTLVVRLVDLQLIQGERFRVLADENRIKQIVLPAPRGKIVDRKGGVMTPGSETSAHVIGYLGQVKEDEVGLLTQGGKYHAGSLVGRTGLEEQYESVLKGIDGGLIVEVDTQGEVVRRMGRKEPIAGKDVQVTLDGGLQDAAYTAVKEKKAGVVVSDPRNGEVLALVSSPSFDPNEVSAKFDVLSSQEDLPFFNRAISGAYAPGSTFKMITTIAAIESGKVEPRYTYNDSGIIIVGPYKYTNWYFTKRGGMEGVVGFSRAITRSTDTFFYKIGELTGPGKIVEWARKLGLGEKTEVDLAGESPGWLPEPTEKGWYLGNTYHLAIGQEDTLATPLQINVMTNTLANGGRKCKPHLVSNNDQCFDVQISGEILEIIKKGMVGACSPGGTAFPFFDWNEAALVNRGSASFAKASEGQSLPVIACKTGTAEYVAETGVLRTHGWLPVYAPAGNREISATVVIEGGGEGSDVAAPVVRKIFAEYFGVEDRYPYGSIRGQGE